MNGNTIRTLLTAATIGLFQFGCEQSNFSTKSNSGQQSNPNPNPQQTSIDQQPTFEPECADTASAQHFNIVFIFDNSGSMEVTDPSNARLTGAKSFLSQFASLKSTKPSLSADAAVVVFSEGAKLGERSWMSVDHQNYSEIEAEIDWTLDYPAKRTEYLSGLQTAKEAFESRPNKMGINYYIFLTDGEPTDPDPNWNPPPIGDQRPPNLPDLENKILQMTSTLVTTENAALITVAAGSALKQDDLSLIEKMAIPKTGSVRGIFKTAVTGEDFKGVWDQIYQEVVNCL